MRTERDPISSTPGAEEGTPGTLDREPVGTIGEHLDAFEASLDEAATDESDEVDPVTRQGILMVAATVAGIVAATGLGLGIAALVWML